jgi:hypothetical protein
MSLHPDVQNLAAQGRNGDSMLLHVTPDEVQGLHQLALMHGTKMTINPVTGLPEANFMKDWLPVIVGGLATIATGGMAAPFMIGAGALSAFGTSMAVGNSFKKSLFTGLMAGAGGALGAGLGAAGGAAAGGVGTTIGTVAAEAAPGVFGAAGRGIASQALTKGISAGATEAAAGGLGGFASTQGANLASGAGRFGAQEAQALMRTEAQQIAQNATQKSFQEAGKIAADNARRPMVNQFGKTIDPTQVNRFQAGGKGPFEPLTNAQAMANPSYSQMPSFQGMKPGYTAPMGQPLPANIGPASYGAPPSSIMPPPSITPPAPQSYMSGVSDALSAQGRGVNKLFEPGEFSKFAGNNKLALAGLGAGAIGSMSSDRQQIKPATAHGDYYSYPGFTQGYDPTGGASGQQYFNYDYGTPTVTHYADGGSVGNEVNNVMYPQSQLPTGAVGQYGNRSAVPVPREVVGAQDAVVNPFTGAEGMAAGGIATLGGYSDGGRLTQGPGDGVSDSIPASIGGKQPARLADGEFVIPARIVSEIGNGSTKAGAKKLYAMMDRIQKARRKTKDIAANTRADRFMPA